MIAYVTLILALVGLLLYVLPSNQKLVELGRLTFFAGILGFALSLASKTVKLF